MSSIEELEQDISSLRSELESLSAKSAGLRTRIDTLRKADQNQPTSQTKTKKKHNPNEKNKNKNKNKKKDKRIKGVMNEFGPIFNKFPQLHEILTKEYRFDETDEKDVGQTSIVSDTSVSPVTPHKKNKKQKIDENQSKSETNYDEDHSLPEHEWVLKNQATIEHQMFDNSVGDVLDTTILSSPSKRKQRPRANSPEVQSNKLVQLKENVIKENTFRLFGVTFFPVIDPTDLQLNVETQELDITREMLGIRFDIFNQVQNKFETPFYILLKRRLKSRSWFIFKHTIPSYIDIEVMFTDITINGTTVDEYDDIYLFSKEVYLQLWNNSIRSQFFEDLVQQSIIAMEYNDMRSTRVQFSIKETPIKLELQLKEDQIKSIKVLEGIDDVDMQANVAMVLLGSIYELKSKLEMIRINVNQ